MKRQFEDLQHSIDTWPGALSGAQHEADVTQPFGEHNTSLLIHIQGKPTYLPLLQPKSGYSHYGKHMRSLRVLGLSRDATWIEDGRASGKISRDYGPAEQAFGVVPFSLAPLPSVQSRYPELANLIWNQQVVKQVASRYLTKAQRLREQVDGAPDVSSPVDLGEVSRIRGELSLTCAALGRLETPDTVNWLTEALSSRSALLREMALYGCSHMFPGQAPTSTTESGSVNRLRAGNSTQRMTMMRNPLPGLLASFTALLNDLSPNVRRMAVASIRIVGTQRAIETLIGLIEKPTELTSAAVDALVALDAAEGSAPVHALLSTPSLVDLLPPRDEYDNAHEAAMILQSATLALQTFWQPADVELIRSLLRHPVSRVRAAAAYVALSQHLVVLENELLRCFEYDEAPEARVEAGYALVAFGDRRVIPTLRKRGRSASLPHTNPFDGKVQFESTEVREMLQRLEQTSNS